MKLNAARKAKQVIQRDIQDTLFEHVQQLANRPPGQAWAKNKPAIPLLSVGIAQGAGAGDYRVAVRICRHGYRVETLNKVFARHRAADMDLRYVGRIFPIGVAPMWIRSGDSSVSHYLTGTGTIGCPVTDLSTGERMLLSNNHVIALENDAVLDDPVIDPGADDGGRPETSTVARFARCVKLDFSGEANVVDCAVARMTAGVRLAPPDGAGFVYNPSLPPALASRNSLMRKIGRSTGLTSGRVTAIEVSDFFVDYQNGPAAFKGQIEVTGISGAFAAHGDSGSLVVNERGAAVGLLFAVSETGVAYVNPIMPVLQQLGVALSS
ncbi:hypothetical protein [Variovorax sp. E3]|uniref:hypothetical protein n=1 Tax=Variovorax sp. E3 TaxID=1914993 RepID=UPI0018DE8DE0|nr:hypothetical protein [Variovorax sp. E3]